jgi:hypothetical protein
LLLLNSRDTQSRSPFLESGIAHHWLDASQKWS